MLQLIGKSVLGKFSLDVVAGTAHARTVGTTALDHEAPDHAVEDQAVIEVAVDQADEVADGNGSDLRIKLQTDFCSVLHGDGNNRIFFHNECPFCLK